MQFEGKTLRHELKYFINPATYYDLRAKLKAVLKTDMNMVLEAGYNIKSLYFDDIRNRAIYEKEDGAQTRKKYRIRIYNGSDALIRLECKEKYDSFISKQSASLTREQYESLLAGNYDFLPKMGRPVCTDLFCAHKTSLMAPKVVVDYVREAYVAREGNVRITFDKQLQASIHGVDLFDTNLILTPILTGGLMILEVKYDDFIPNYVRRMLRPHPMDKCAISKYLLCVNQQRKVSFL